MVDIVTSQLGTAVQIWKRVEGKFYRQKCSSLWKHDIKWIVWTIRGCVPAISVIRWRSAVAFPDYSLNKLVDPLSAKPSDSLIDQEIACAIANTLSPQSTCGCSPFSVYFFVHNLLLETCGTAGTSREQRTAIISVKLWIYLSFRVRRTFLSNSQTRQYQMTKQSSRRSSAVAARQ